MVNINVMILVDQKIKKLLICVRMSETYCRTINKNNLQTCQRMNKSEPIVSDITKIIQTYYELQI